MNISSRVLHGTIVFVFAILLGIGWFFVENQQRGRKQDLEIYKNFLVQEAERLDQAFSQLISVSDLLKKNPVIIHILDQHSKKHIPSQSATLLLNKNLQAITGIDKVSAVFLMSLDGECLYSSNASFVGKNYGFRPYFRDALDKGSGMYTAMGITSQQPGIYYAQSVTNGTVPVGVAVIKIMPSFFNIHSLLSLFAQTTPTDNQLRVGLATANGFFINSQDYQVFFLGSLLSSQADKLRKSRQFPPERIRSLHFPKDVLQALEQGDFVKGYNAQGTEYYLFKEHLLSTDLFLLHIIDANWFLESYRPASSSYKTMMYMMGTILALLLFMLFFLNKQHLSSLESGEQMRKETVQRLQEKRKYEAIINSNPEGFCLFDTESKRILDVNDSFCQLVGKNAEDILGRSVDTFISEHDGEGEFSAHSSWNQGSFEGLLFLEDNQQMDILVHAGELPEDDKSAGNAFCFVADITERNRQQRKLRLFSRVVEQSPSGIVITTTAGRIVYTNPAFTKMTGYTAEEAYGRNPSILKSGETNPETIKVLWEVISSGRNWKGYVRNKKKDGTLYWEGQAISPVFDSHNKISHYLAIKNDITERIDLENQIASKRAELELIVEHAAIGISYIVGSRFLWVSKAGAEMFGYQNMNDAVGLATESLFLSSETWQAVIKRSIQCFVEGKVFEDEQLMQRRDGSTFWCSLTGKVINPNDLSQGAIWLTQDISAQKDVEKHLQLARDRAQQASREKSNFLANMSHEIRTPMNSIIGMTSLALDTRLDEQQQYLLNTIRHSADFLLGLLNDILDFSKIESGLFELDKRPFEVKNVVSQVLQTMNFLAQKKGLTLNSYIDSDIPLLVYGDDLRLRQILLNLIGNAIKFTEQGAINVRVSSLREDEETLTLEFQVQDHGIGIAPEKIETIFEAFVQADSSISRHFGGTGLGLSISYKLCKLMGGDMTVESRQGQGTTFIFSILLKRVDEKEVAKLENERAVAELPEVPLRILLVDDNEANRYLTQAMLEKYDNQVVEAKNGLEALTILLDHHFDVILMDVQMPKMDGMTATRIIRDCEQGEGNAPEQHLPSWLSASLRSRLFSGHVPIVALTAHALSEDRVRCLDAGMDGYAVKPFKPADIISAIQRSIALVDDSYKQVEEPGACAEVNNQKKTAKELTGKISYISSITCHLKEVYRLDETQVKEMLAFSADSLAETLEDMTTFLSNDNLEEVAACAHKAKGSLLGLGLDGEVDLAKKLESCAKEGNKVVCAEVHSMLKEHIAPLLALSVTSDNAE